MGKSFRFHQRNQTIPPNSAHILQLNKCQKKINIFQKLIIEQKLLNNNHNIFNFKINISNSPRLLYRKTMSILNLNQILTIQLKTCLIY